VTVTVDGAGRFPVDRVTALGKSLAGELMTTNWAVRTSQASFLKR
jgi:hypothetical protein